MTVRFARALPELTEWFRYRPLPTDRPAVSVLSPFLNDTPAAGRDARGRLLDDGSLGGACLLEADCLLQKGLVTFLAYQHLIGGGHLSWSLQTLYHALLFTVSGLTRLQGAGHVHVHGQGVLEYLPTVLPGVWELQRVQTRGSTHRLTWGLFRRAYADFRHPQASGIRPLLGRTDPDQEAEFRNAVLYDLQFGFAELNDPDAATRTRQAAAAGEPILGGGASLPGGFSAETAWAGLRLGLTILDHLRLNTLGKGLDWPAYLRLAESLPTLAPAYAALVLELQTMAAYTNLPPFNLSPTIDSPTGGLLPGGTGT